MLLVGIVVDKSFDLREVDDMRQEVDIFWGDKRWEKFIIALKDKADHVDEDLWSDLEEFGVIAEEPIAKTWIFVKTIRRIRAKEKIMRVTGSSYRR